MKCQIKTESEERRPHLLDSERQIASVGVTTGRYDVDMDNSTVPICTLPICSSTINHTKTQVQIYKSKIVNLAIILWRYFFYLLHYFTYAFFVYRCSYPWCTPGPVSPRTAPFPAELHSAVSLKSAVPTMLVTLSLYAGCWSQGYSVDSIMDTSRIPPRLTGCPPATAKWHTIPYPSLYK